MATDAPLVLGLDPGSAAFGWGVVKPRGRNLSLHAAGVIRTPAKAPLAQRLAVIHAGLTQVIALHQPAEVAVESVFTAKNMKSALVLGHARGVGLLAAALCDLPVFEYTPASVKMALVGSGRAQKEQVRHMVRALLGTKENLPLDASDALAVAITHVHSRKIKGVIQ